MKPILVTGGAQGLGREICRTLAQRGYPLVIHYRTSKQQALELAQECSQYVEVETLYGDFGSLQGLEQFIAHYLDRFSDTQGLVNNVGNYLIAPSEKTDSSQWLELFQTNFFTPVFLARALLPALRVNKGGVVNIGVAGLHTHRGSSERTAYMATKSALYFYTLSLAKELAFSSVRVNMVSPGYMENAVDLKDPSNLPFQRPATLREVAQVVASLFEPESLYITGQNIDVAGGVGL